MKFVQFGKKRAMLNQLFRTVEHRLTSLNFQQVTMLVLVVVVIGVVCLRGFGSRTNY